MASITWFRRWAPTRDVFIFTAKWRGCLVEIEGPRIVRHNCPGAGCLGEKMPELSFGKKGDVYGDRGGRKGNNIVKHCKYQQKSHHHLHIFVRCQRFNFRDWYLWFQSHCSYLEKCLFRVQAGLDRNFLGVTFLSSPQLSSLQYVVTRWAASNMSWPGYIPFLLYFYINSIKLLAFFWIRFWLLSLKLADHLVDRWQILGAGRQTLT